MRSSFSCAALALIVVLHGDPTQAGVYPSGFYSTISRPMMACPAGDVVFRVLARDYMNRPLPNTLLHLKFDRCPAVRFSPPMADEGYQRYPDGPTPVQLTTATDAGAEAKLGIRAGGTCSGLVWLYMNGMILDSRPFVSPDQDGDLTVDANDAVIAESKLGTVDLTADFDGDGTVTAADLDLLDGHVGHRAAGITPVASRTWGTLKLLYR